MLDPVQVRQAGLQEAKNMDCRWMVDVRAVEECMCMCMCAGVRGARTRGTWGAWGVRWCAPPAGEERAGAGDLCRGALLPGGQVWTCAGCGETRPKAKVGAKSVAVAEDI